ncbi:serine/threonine-protein kinase SRPK3 [Xylaria arbuscula]|nr:serine/threonine-protein kinase SRPK3 [Xylaria arbuscula]
MSSPSTPPHTMPLGKDSRFEPMCTPCESIEMYRPGGFHPVIVGDTLHKRYRVIRKLGAGSHATVWLAEDTARVKYVALKVHAAKVDVTNEVSIQQQLGVNISKDISSRFLILASDSFILEGPNGRHFCFVTEPMGPSISTVLKAPCKGEFDPLNPPDNRLSTSRNKGILRSVLSGLELLHSNDIVHGDLQPGDLLFPLGDISNFTPNELQSTALRDLVKRKDGKTDLWSPKYLIAPEPITEESVQVRDMVRLADFGGAFRNDHPPSSPVTPLAYRAPEIILGSKVDCAIDIWSFGCFMFELLTDTTLFRVSGFFNPPQVVDDTHFIELSDVLGPLPQYIRDAWPRYSLYYGQNGDRLNSRPSDFDDTEEGKARRARWPSHTFGLPVTQSLEDRFLERKSQDMGMEEAQEILSLLREILQIEPSKRPSVAQLLAKRWFQV